MRKMKPSVSIIIPCRNEVKYIDKCLASVFSFTPVDGEIEVIVVDGMPDDGTRDILKKWEILHSNITIHDNPKRIVPTAMNIGIKKACGKWIVNK